MEHPASRSELSEVHSRITNIETRVVHLEAQQPHINAALVRIEGSVDKLSNRIGKALWIVVTPFVALMVGVLFKALTSGAFASFL